MLALWAGYLLTGQPVTVLIDDHAYQQRVHQLTVDAVVREMGLTLEPEDIIRPPIGAQLAPNQTITIELARPVVLSVDGRTLEWFTHQESVTGVLSEAGIITNARDEVFVGGSVAAPETLLPPPPWRSFCLKIRMQPAWL